MKERLSTLYLDCKRAGAPNFLVDTVLRGVLGYQDGDRPPRLLRNNARLQALFAELHDPYAALSYGADWRDASVASPSLAVEVCYIHDLFHLTRCLLWLRKYDLIVISHVATGDDMSLLLRTRTTSTVAVHR